MDLIYLLARMYREKKDLAKADQLAQRATEVKPDDYQTYLVLSAYRDQIGDNEGALAAARKAAEVAPDDATDADLRVAEVLLEIGFMQNQPDKIQEGKEIVEKALAAKPGDPGAVFVNSELASRITATGRDPGCASIDHCPIGEVALPARSALRYPASARARSRSSRARSISTDMVEARPPSNRVTPRRRAEYAVEEGAATEERPDDFAGSARGASLVNLYAPTRRSRRSDGRNDRKLRGN